MPETPFSAHNEEDSTFHGWPYDDKRNTKFGSLVTRQIEEEGFDGTYDRWVSGEGGGGGCGEVVVIPGNDNPPCTPFILVFAKGGPLPVANGRSELDRVLDTLKKRLIKCKNITKEVDVFTDHWNPDTFKVFHQQELEDLSKTHNVVIRFHFVSPNRRDVTQPPRSSRTHLGLSLTNLDKILTVLSNGKSYCDDCLSHRSGVTHRQQVRAICLRESKKTGRINRIRDICYVCKKNKITNILNTSCSPAIGSGSASRTAGCGAVTGSKSGTTTSWQGNLGNCSPLPFTSEDQLRVWLVSELSKALPATEWKVLQGKNVADIVVCFEGQPRVLMLFIEVKYHKKQKDRIGIGGMGGSGYQPEYLGKKPAYLERYLKWLVVSKLTGIAVWMSNDEVRANLLRRQLAAKANNLSPGVFADPSLDRFCWDTTVVAEIIKRLQAMV